MSGDTLRSARHQVKVFPGSEFLSGAEALDTPERQAAFLSAMFEDGAPEEIRDALRTVARARGMTEIAKAAGISRVGLYKALGDKGNPEFDTVVRIMRAMGLTIKASAKQPARKRAKAAA